RAGPVSAATHAALRGAGARPAGPQGGWLRTEETGRGRTRTDHRRQGRACAATRAIAADAHAHIGHAIAGKSRPRPARTEAREASVWCACTSATFAGRR